MNISIRNELSSLSSSAIDDVPVPRRITLRGVAWAITDAGRFPYLHLITGFVFLPYFTSVLVKDPIRGQEHVASLGTIAGLIAAFTGPLVGATFDLLGPRKPSLAVGTGVMAGLLALLWWAHPGPGGLGIGTIIGILVVVKVAYSYTEVMHNSLLVLNAKGGSVSHLSALNYGIGHGSALILLGFVLWAFVLPGRYDLWWIPTKPLFGLDGSTYENLRIVGPIAGLNMALWVLPIMLIARDHPPTGVGAKSALAGGLRYLRKLPHHLKNQPNAALFIFVRMIYADGTTAMTLFTGIYAAGVMHWGPTEVLILGIVRLGFMVAGSFVSIALEERFGSRRAVQIGLFAMIVALIGLVSTSPDQIFFWWKGDWLTAPVLSVPVFRTVPELTFLAFTLGTGTFQVVISAASRTFLTQITPPEETGAFFGLFALASTATAWLAPLFIGYFTASTGNQQGGFSPVIAFFVLGLVGLGFVKGR